MNLGWESKWDLSPALQCVFGFLATSQLSKKANTSTGLRSTNKIFIAMMDGLEWAHYLDNFIMIGSLDSTICQQSLNTLLATCDVLKVPLASHKLEGPSSCLVLSGIEIDMGMGHLCLPTEKLA